MKRDLPTAVQLEKGGGGGGHGHPTRRAPRLVSLSLLALILLASALLALVLDALPAEHQPALLADALCTLSQPLSTLPISLALLAGPLLLPLGRRQPTPTATVESIGGPSSTWRGSGLGCHSRLGGGGGGGGARTFWRLPEERKAAAREEPDADELPDLLTATLEQLERGLDRGLFTSVQLVKAYLARIEEVNHAGPKLNAVIETAPREYLLAEAARRDEERAQGKKRGYLHGIPILVKDNFATNASMSLNTTAGSYALLGAVSPRNARIITDAVERGGAIILGKTNMSAWAHAYFPGGNTCGSSSGSAVAASVGLAGATLGTETDGSIVCPASSNALVGFKPTVGLVSRAGTIPISSTQDSGGPIVQTVADAARVLTDVATLGGFDGGAAGEPRALEGVRIGILADEFVNATLGEFDPAVLPL
ncbi:hypothetical protein OC842_007535 [Tilletia horrida]|uniref:Amidase domain-containing protein n=1 Tax=Tilletia horrida TaxID=155126 RepID=A0AAN6G5Y1_9BASI|nr:hypothetical protein OC842_007535 [Tilletia horrida]